MIIQPVGAIRESPLLFNDRPSWLFTLDGHGIRWTAACQALAQKCYNRSHSTDELATLNYLTKVRSPYRDRAMLLSLVLDSRNRDNREDCGYELSDRARGQSVLESLEGRKSTPPTFRKIQNPKSKIQN